MALGAMLPPAAWENWTEIALGAWMVLAPRMFGYSNIAGATINGLGCGFVVSAGTASR